VEALLSVPREEVEWVAGPVGGNDWCFEGNLLSSHDEETIGGRGVMLLLWRKRGVSGEGDESERRRGSEGEGGRFCGELDEDDHFLGSLKTDPIPKDMREARGCIGSDGGGAEGAGGILDEMPTRRQSTGMGNVRGRRWEGAESISNE
jgi:hypothetical protein